MCTKTGSERASTQRNKKRKENVKIVLRIFIQNYLRANVGEAEDGTNLGKIVMLRKIQADFNGFSE